MLDAAREEFARNGYSAVSVRSIAKCAGATAAMINYYFGSKQALYDAVVAEAQARLLARLSRAIADGDRDDLPERLAVAYFDFLTEERQLQRLLVRQMLDQSEHVRARAGKLIGPLRVLLESHFGEREVAHQFAVSVFGAISGYFLYEPVLGELLGEDPLSKKSLGRRRRHVIELASLIRRSNP